MQQPDSMYKYARKQPWKEDQGQDAFHPHLITVLSGGRQVDHVYKEQERKNNKYNIWNSWCLDMFSAPFLPL